MEHQENKFFAWALVVYAFAFIVLALDLLVWRAC